MARPLILLDRDGVINQLRPHYVTSVADFAFEENADKALEVLSEKFARIAVCSNQRGVSRGMVSLQVLTQIEAKIQQSLPEKAAQLSFYYCTHALEENCNCRKPKPGLLESAIQDVTSQADLRREDVIFVGDNVSDYFAAENAGVGFALVLTGHGAKYASQIPTAVPRFDDLYQFALEV